MILICYVYELNDNLYSTIFKLIRTTGQITGLHLHNLYSTIFKLIHNIPDFIDDTFPVFIFYYI